MMVTMLGSDSPRIGYSDVHLNGAIQDIWGVVKEGAGLFVPGLRTEDPSVARASIEAEVERKKIQMYTILGMSAVGVVVFLSLTKKKRRNGRR